MFVPTIHDVAKFAGVSAVTVSRVINGAGNVNSETRVRVEQAVKELSYLPNLAARSLRSKQTMTLALLVPDITNSFWTTVARGVEDAAQGGGYSVFLCNTDESPAKQQDYIQAVLKQRVDGVIIAPYDIDAKNLSSLREQNTPTVVIDRRVEGWEVDTVHVDSIAGARAIVQHLIRFGHRRIAMISGPTSTSTAQDRVKGYFLALKEAGIEVDERLIRYGEYRSDSGMSLTNQLLSDGLQPTAVFAANNAIAVGVLEALQKHNLRVPRDVALVCFDDVPEMAHIFPFLTVVSQSAYDMGVNAAELILSRINAGVSFQPRHIILPARLILRYSCGRTLKDDSVPSIDLNPFQQIQTESVLVQS